MVPSVRDNYDRIADEYARHLFGELRHKPLDRELLTRFAAGITGHGSVCDMGCGPGQVARFLCDAGVGAFGLDLSPQMVERARELNPDIPFREGNMLALDLDDGSLAGIVAFYSIVNITPQLHPQVFREMQRVLQPGGLLLLAFHVGDEAVHVNELWGRSISMDFFFFRPEQIQSEIEAAGLRVEQLIERGPYAPEVEHQSRRAYIFARKPDFNAGM